MRHSVMQHILVTNVYQRLSQVRPPAKQVPPRHPPHPSAAALRPAWPPHRRWAPTISTSGPHRPSLLSHGLPSEACARKMQACASESCALYTALLIRNDGQGTRRHAHITSTANVPQMTTLASRTKVSGPKRMQATRAECSQSANTRALLASSPRFLI